MTGHRPLVSKTTWNDLFLNDFGNPGTSRVLSFQLFFALPIITSYPPELNMEPENHSLKKEKHMPNFCFFGFQLSVFHFSSSSLRILTKTTKQQKHRFFFHDEKERR